MRDKITRRDFLNGAALSVAATALAPYSSLSIGSTANGNLYYPPLLTGMRGSHKGSFEVAHALVMGRAAA
jgi:spermidine dehydrogenase